ncbi:oligopeptide ABC transporter permease [Bacillus fonticola]|uniref:oligopeptide ABC transporter permease n=1 Tax=Bacillus fonticola TaxID=2728853 RepID=UPI001474191B|nr:oligopeptide ABC transporter permease [Bacillus fonticola]
MANKPKITKVPKELFQPANVHDDVSEKIVKPSLSFWQDAWLRIRKNWGAIISLFLIIIIIIMAFLGPVISGYDSEKQDTSRAYMPSRIPVLENVSWLPFDGENDDGVNEYVEKGREDEYYYFGTDRFGRDLFTRVWEGTQISLYIAFLAAFIDMVIGVTYGAVSGYYGGRTDNIMQRIIEILTGIPNLIVVILMILILKPGILSITIALTITGWTGMARVVRAQVMKLKNQEFVLASRTLGASDRRIMAKHLYPNTFGLMIINTMFTIPSAIFFEAFLSFIGLGLTPPTASLGTLIESGFRTMRQYPENLWFPAIVLILIMICFNLLADGMRDAFDPKMRK